MALWPLVAANGVPTPAWLRAARSLEEPRAPRLIWDDDVRELTIAPTS